MAQTLILEHPKGPTATRLFFELPTELRLHVYREIFLVGELSIRDGHATIRKGPHKKVQISLGIMQTCKLAYKESHAILYGENRFSFCSADGAKLFLDVTQAGDAIHHIAIRQMLGSLAFSHHPEDIYFLSQTFRPLIKLRILRLHVEHWIWANSVVFNPENNPALVDGTILKDAIAPDEPFVNSFIRCLAMKGVNVFVDLSILPWEDYERYRFNQIQKIPLPHDYRYQITISRSPMNPDEVECSAAFISWLTENNAKGIYEDEFSDAEGECSGVRNAGTEGKEDEKDDKD
jgi:hypothetical protein